MKLIDVHLEVKIESLNTWISWILFNEKIETGASWMQDRVKTNDWKRRRVIRCWITLETETDIFQYIFLSLGA